VTSTTLNDSNAALRQAVQDRHAAAAAGKPHDQWYETPATANSYTLADFGSPPPERKSAVHPTSQAFFDRLQQIKNLHTEKTSQYGAPDDPFANVTASEKCGVEPWRRALCDASDCIVRLQRYAHGQPVDFENAVMDGINWLLICWLKHDESRQ
jgi:hypothetical protein